MLVRCWMVIDVQFSVRATFGQQVRKKRLVDVVIQVGDGDLDGRRFTDVVLVDFEPRQHQLHRIQPGRPYPGQRVARVPRHDWWIRGITRNDAIVPVNLRNAFVQKRIRNQFIVPRGLRLLILRTQCSSATSG